MTVPQNLAPLIYCNAYEKTRESLKFHLGLSSDKLVSSLAGKFVSAVFKMVRILAGNYFQYCFIISIVSYSSNYIKLESVLAKSCEVIKCKVSGY